jgi:hypothetical protein
MVLSVFLTIRAQTLDLIVNIMARLIMMVNHFPVAIIATDVLVILAELYVL